MRGDSRAVLTPRIMMTRKKTEPSNISPIAKLTCIKEKRISTYNTKWHQNRVYRTYDLERPTFAWKMNWNGGFEDHVRKPPSLPAFVLAKNAPFIEINADASNMSLSLTGQGLFAYLQSAPIEAQNFCGQLAETFTIDGCLEERWNQKKMKSDS